MRAICILVVGWLAAALAGHAVGQSASSAAADTCRADIEDNKLDARELVCLRELGRLANRRGDTLSLQLENGTSKVYRTDTKACEADDAQHCVQYWLAGYHPVAHVYSIVVKYYEGSGVELVSARTGAKLLLPGVPFFSDDGANFLIIDNDYAHGGEYDLAVGSTAGDAPALQWKHAQDALFEWRHQRWIDEDHVALRVFPADTEQKCPDDNCDAVLVRFNDGWTVRRVPATSK
ncbi:hypothetical protein JQ596_21685 [Bradyrhizobium manausense]|uniref:hypothetical protein n=1 Tax=Bradyrhizobium TaxID=374 RepID=UPI001BA5A6DB|nr:MULTISPECIES: hypothetical protein [Bradyrhizobium]MBR0828152.1 hypothetical protein [Bradyrhizobium manausense]UVO33007.1 hypothetical protein KUF59_21490 [Bradyrhizobium arachidis]